MFKRWLKIDSTKSALIIGPRRSGKTTFLKANYPDFKYSTLDDLDCLNWAKKDAKGFINDLGKKAIIDEIQRFPQLTIAVKYAIDNKKSLFLMSGSSSIGLLDSFTDSLAGRINIFSMPTVCWGENYGEPTHLIFKDELSPIKIIKAQRLLNEVSIYGHFPEILNYSDIEKKKEILKNYKNTYFIRDIMQLSNIMDLDGLLSIFYNIGRSIGSTLDISNFARESGLSFQTTKKYLNILNQSQLTFKLYGYQYGPAKRYVKSTKTYFADNGIITGLNIKLNEGQIFESFIINELEKRRKLGYIKCDQLFYYKSCGGREIDVIFESEEILYAIEIKASSKYSTKDIRNLIEFKKQLNKKVKLFLINMGTDYYYEKGVSIIPVASLFKGI